MLLTKFSKFFRQFTNMVHSEWVVKCSVRWNYLYINARSYGVQLFVRRNRKHVGILSTMRNRNEILFIDKL
uniref:Transposase n=1 Tax=Ascaris lumbricoides TaxID=6252 RepID=A0A0M3HK91_ASCLU